MNMATLHHQPTVAVIGAGYWGKHLIRNFAELGTLRAICESRMELLQEFHKMYPQVLAMQNLDDVWRDQSITAVAIASPAETHGIIVQQALQAGKDVFVEKPICLSVEEGDRLIQLAKSKGRILMVGHLLWYHPAVLKLKSMVDAGDLGRIQYIYSNRLNLGKIRREENILWSFAPHDISIILGLLNEMPVRVAAQGGNYLHEGIADVTVSFLSFASGVRAHIFVSWLHPYKEQKLVVVGDRKMAVFDDVEGTSKLLLYPHSIDWEKQIPVAKKAEAQAVPLDEIEPLRAECLHFLECIQTRQTPRTDGSEAIRVLTVLNQCQKALESPSALLEGKTTSGNVMIHNSAWVDEDVTIGEGTQIWHVSHLLKGSRIGKHCKIGQNVVIGPRSSIGNRVKIQNNVSVYEGVTLEDDVFCGPAMVFTNIINPRSAIQKRRQEIKTTLVKKGATLGANCTIVCGVTIGVHAFVGAGAVVTRDVPDYALMIGNPARISGWMCSCGVKLTINDGTAHCKTCNLSYRKEKDRLVLQL